MTAESPDTARAGSSDASLSSERLDTPTSNARMVFDQPGDFAAIDAAEAWCAARGISVGSMERGSPRGLMRGDYSIAKWRNLTGAERRALHGTMTGGRGGPVVVSVRLPDVAEAVRPDEQGASK